MERLRSSVIVAAILALGPGCAGGKFWKAKDEPAKMPEGVPMAPLSSTVTGKRDADVVQASARTPGTIPATNSVSFNPFAKKVEAKKAPAAEMTVMWRNKIDYLPDPSRNGEMGAGLVGQLFLLDRRDQFAMAEGKLIVALYDESPRPPGMPANKPEGWEFTKETLKGLLTPDERFGLCYAVFLPWPTYRPDVTRVRIAARFEPEGGYPLYAKDTYITLDNRTSPNEGGGVQSHSFTPGTGAQPAGGFSPLGGPPPAGGVGGATGPGLGVSAFGGAPPGAATPVGGFGPQPGAAMPAGGPGRPMMPLPPVNPGAGGPIGPAPANFGAVAPVAGPPGRPISEAELQNLPPIAFTVPPRQR